MLLHPTLFMTLHVFVSRKDSDCVQQMHCVMSVVQAIGCWGNSFDFCSNWA